MHIPLLMVIGLLRRNTIEHLVVEVAIPVFGLTALSALNRFNPVHRAIVTTTGLTLCSSILVHLTDGLIESHFHFFVLVPLVTLYQHWTPFLVMIAWVLFHHGVVGVLDPRSVYNHPAAVNSPVKWAVIHGVFVLAASLASLFAWRRNQDERERTELLLAASAQPLYGRDPEGRITMASQSLADLLGSTPVNIVGRHDHDLLHLGPADVCEICARVASGTASSLRYPEFTVGGRTFPVEVSSRLVSSPSGVQGVAVSFSDVTVRRAHEDDLRRRALYDDLTGLANRTLLMERLGTELRRLEREDGHIAVLFIDLDGFKLVNDSYGHAVGDQILVETARRLENLARPVDTTARIGGDEFVMVVPGLPTPELAADMSDRLTAGLTKPYEIDGAQLAVSASVGLRVSDDPHVEPQSLLRDADDALYVSKLRNRGGMTEFDSTMRTDAERELAMASLLRGAVGRGELRVVYQPQVLSRSGRVIGFEALCRWTSPELGDVSPGEFIPLAERNGQIFDIGRFVLDEATSQLTRWSNQIGRADVRVSVNVSPHQLNERALIDRIQSMLERGLVGAAQLVVEVTETTVVASESRAQHHLAELRQLGVRVAVDDFGTGYSSLASLRTLPADELKIDRAFVTGVSDDPRGQEMIKVVVAMAGVLGLEVTAEGTESQADVDMVRSLGCDLIQGYAIGHPMPPDEAIRLVDAALPDARPLA